MVHPELHVVLVNSIVLAVPQLVRRADFDDDRFGYCDPCLLSVSCEGCQPGSLRGPEQHMVYPCPVGRPL